MANKMNYACNACGMASGRRESVQRHINNPNKHNGNARVISFVEYLAGRAAGVYSIVSNPSRTRGPYNVRDPEVQEMKGSFLDRIQKKVEEKVIDRIAENAANQTIPSPPFLSSSKISYPIRQQSFSYPGENIFGIGGYVCPNCCFIKPIIFPYENVSNGPPTQSLVYPMQLCYGNRDLGSPQEQIEYLNYNKINGFPTVLQTWVRKIWSNGKKMKLKSLQIQGSVGSSCEQDRLKEIRYSANYDYNDNIGNPQFSNRKNMLKVTVEQNGLSTVKKLIILDYDSSNMIQMDAVLSISNHPSIRSGVSNASILKAIEASEQLITSEDELLSFLSYTKFKTFGFFSIENGSYLMMLIPEEYSLSRSYSCQLIRRSS
jgi:hypothetical protein